MSITARLQNCLRELKSDYENRSGAQGQISAIRSGAIINHLEEWCVQELVREGIPSSAIKKNFKAKGYFKTKEQDIAVLCQKPGCNIHSDISPLSINVRSQLSSIQKNFDTLYERLIAEGLNLHVADPNHVAGYVYLLPLVGYNEKELKKGNVQLDENYQRAKYLRSFELISDRTSPTDKEWKYERMCLLIVDFSCDPPEIITGAPSQPLDADLFSGIDTNKVWKCLGHQNFFSDLITMANNRVNDCMRPRYVQRSLSS